MDVWKSLNLDSQLGETARLKKAEIQRMMEQIEPQIQTYSESASFPQFLFKSFKDIEYAKTQAPKKYGGLDFTIFEKYSFMWEIAKVDSSIATFIGHNSGLGIATIEACGDDEQKERLLPDCYNMHRYTSFALSEPNFGSDATSIESFAVKATDGRDGYILNGVKRWIANGTLSDQVIVWAKNRDEKNLIQAFLVEKDQPGFVSTKMEGKWSIRMVQNADMKFDNVFVPTKNKLKYAINFEKSLSRVLLSSRLGVAWMITASAAGAYEQCLKYCLQRKQFGRPIASFQLIQERLSRMLANVESCAMLCVHLIKMFGEDKLTIGQASRAKHHCSKVARETIALARECMGGNGILIENRVIKSMMDMEALYTYEGTYDINSLISGREITGGLSAFK